MQLEPAEGLKLGLGQLCSQPAVAANVAILARALAILAGQGADLAVFPEYCLCLDTLERQREATRRQEEWQEVLGELSRRQRLAAVFAGIPVRDGDGGVRNSALAFAADGTLLARYDKARLFSWAGGGGAAGIDERQIFTPGQAPPAVFPLRGWQVALTLCYDLRFPRHWQAAQPAADLYLCPAAFTDQTGRAHWQPLLQARAIENLAYVAGIGQAGENHGTGLPLHGHSCVFAPWGERLLGLRRGRSGCRTILLDPERLRQARSALPGVWAERSGSLADPGAVFAARECRRC